MHSFLRDIRFAARSLRKSPALSAVSIIALALGIGLTTTMFSIIYGAIIKGLPVENAERIVAVQRENPTRGIRRMGMPIHDYRDYAEQQRSFEGLAVYYGGSVNVSGAERAERFPGVFITANTFDLLGVRPLLGRGFRTGDDAPGAERVAVLSHAMWRDRYASEPIIIGTTIRANGESYTVVGVMPEKFAFPSEAAIWLPIALDPLALKRGTGPWMRAWGKLRPGMTIESATRDMAAIAGRLATEYKASNQGITALVLPYVEGDLGRQPIQLLYTMLGAVFFVLLIGCANVANLLLDRAAHRTKEVGIRAALGASRVAVVRQFLVEALLLAAGGAALGLGLAHIGITAFTSVIAETQPPFYFDIKLHPPVLLFVVGVAVLASLVSGVIPAIQSARADINEILKDESRGASSFRIGRLSRALVMFEIALSCGLLVAAGLMIKSVAKLRALDPKFTTQNIFTARVAFPSTNTDTVRQTAFFQELETRLGGLPGATAVSLSNALPGMGTNRSTFAVEGATYSTDRDYPESATMSVTPGFFPTFGIKPTAGRAFGSEDRWETMPVVVVNRVIADKYFKGQDPVGRRVRIGGAGSTAPWLTIVGMVPDVYSGDPAEPQTAMIYRAFAQTRESWVTIAVRTERTPLALTAPVRDLVSTLDADIPVFDIYTMEAALARPTWFVRVFGTMFMIFGFVALFLSGVGLYAVMAFSVSRRTRDIGIRVAIGAQTGHVLRMIIGQGLTQLAVGMVLGLALAAGVSQLMTIVLFDVEPRDPAVFASVVGVLMVSGLLACLVPAHRASRIDPLTALREF